LAAQGGIRVRARSFRGFWGRPGAGRGRGGGGGVGGGAITSKIANAIFSLYFLVVVFCFFFFFFFLFFFVSRPGGGGVFFYKGTPGGGGGGGGGIKNKWFEGKKVKLRKVKTVFHLLTLLGEKSCRI